MRHSVFTFEVATQNHFDLIDVTDEVLKWCEKEKFLDGHMLIQSAHTTTAIRINESCDELKKDLTLLLEKLVPQKGNYFHNHSAVDGRNNAHSHLVSYLMGASVGVVVQKGKPLLGSWQRIFFVELDGPRKRRQIIFSFIGS